MRVLVVEDDDVLRDGLCAGLGLEGFRVDAVASCAEARAALDPAGHACVVLDVALPDGSGLTLLAEWRRRGETVPVLVLTARTLVEDRVGGLDAGADDYLGKPFDLSELAARLRSITRRAAGRAAPTVEIDGLRIDAAARAVLLDGAEIALSRREFAILSALAEHPGHVLSRARLEERIYGWGEEVESNAVEVHIHNLRAKIGRAWIETVRGEGYRMLRP